MEAGIGLAFVIGLFLIIYLLRGKNEEQGERVEEKKSKNCLPYTKNQFFFTVKERKFFMKLIDMVEELFPGKYVIFSKVRVPDIISVNPGIKDKIYWRKIQAKHIDFVICDSNYFSPKLVIELNDNSHHDLERNERDNYLNLAFSSAGLQLLFVTQNNNEDYLRMALLNSLSTGNKSQGMSVKKIS